MWEFIRENVVLRLMPRWRFMNTYAQAGEDVIAHYFFITHNIEHPTYLDIGTNKPIYGNNTFLFYKRGNKGVCIEADPVLFKDIVKYRKNDVCLNAGVTFDSNVEADFYIFNERAHNTLSKEEAEYRDKNSESKIKEVIRIPLININKVFESHFNGSAPNFMSLDVEGVDFEILKSMDLFKYRPDLICVETISFSLDHKESKLSHIIDYMITKDYVVYADTHINTIFVDKRYYPKFN